MLRNRSRSSFDGWVPCTTCGTGEAGQSGEQAGGSGDKSSHNLSIRGKTGAVSAESDLEVRRAVEQLLAENYQLQGIEEKLGDLEGK